MRKREILRLQRRQALDAAIRQEGEHQQEKAMEEASGAPYESQHCGLEVRKGQTCLSSCNKGLGSLYLTFGWTNASPRLLGITLNHESR